MGVEPVELLEDRKPHRLLVEPAQPGFVVHLVIAHRSHRSGTQVRSSISLSAVEEATMPS